MSLTLANTINDMRVTVNQLIDDVSTISIDSIGDLTDVDLTGLNDGFVLVYDALDAQFEPVEFQTVGGANNQIQYNRFGDQFADANLTFDFINAILSVPNANVSNIAASNVVTEDLVVNTGGINILSTNTGDIVTLNTNSFTTNTIDASTLNLDSIVANTITTNNLVAEDIQSNTANVVTLTANSITETSSRAFKENVVLYESGLSTVVALEPITYTWIGQSEPHLGLIAEDVAVVEPLLVQQNDDGQGVAVKYSRLVVPLLGAVKELSDRINKLEEQISNL